MTSVPNQRESSASDPPGQMPRWAWVPLAFLVATMVVLGIADLRSSYDPPWLLFTCNFLFATLASAFVFQLLCRSFLAKGTPSLLLLTCGVVSWGLAGVLAVGFAGGSDNAMLTIHNVCAWLSAGFHLAGVLSSEPGRRLRPVGWWLLGGVLLAVGLALAVVKAAVGGWTPLFFVQGEGGTVVRHFVLASGAGMLALSAVILRGRQRGAPSVFARWYGLGLWLIAASMAGLMFQTLHGSALGWTARAAGWLGGLYLLMAARAAARESGGREISLAMPPTDARLRYLLAAVFVAAAVVLRMMLGEALGTRAVGITFFPAIILAALYGGRGPGLLAGLLSVVAIDYFWIGPFGAFSVGAPGDWIMLALLMVSATAISFLAEAMQAARSRASAAEAEVRLAEERRRMEEAAHRVEQRLVGVLAGMSDGFEMVDAEWRVTYLNAAARRMFTAQGHDPDQMIGRHLWDDLFPDLRDTPIHRERQRAMRERVPGEMVNYYAPWQRWYAVRFFPTEEGGQSVLFQDITERTAAEEARARLAAIVENSEDAIIGKNLDGIITSWNRGAERLFGYRASEIVGQPVLVLIPPERHDEEADILGHIRRGEPVEHFETVRRRKDGTLLDVSLTSSPIMDGDGKITGASKIVRDITARKQAEALSAAEVEAMTHLHRAGSLCAKPGEDYDICLGGLVEAAIKLTGAAKGNLQLLDEATGVLTMVAHRGFEEPFLTFFATVRVGESAVCGTATHLAGRVVVEDVMQSEIFAGKPARDVLLAAGVRAVQSTPLVNSAGKVFGMISTHSATPRAFTERELRLMDLLARQAAEYLERRQAEEKLRSSESLYRTIGESIRFGVWVCEPDGRNIYASQSFLDLVGLTQEQCSSFGWGEVLHPDDAPATIAAWQECVRTGGQWNREHRFRGVDGRWHHVLARGMPVKDEEGDVVQWAGINLDISDLKAAEQALRTSEEFKRSIIVSSPDCIKVLDIQGNLLSLEAGHDLLGLSDFTPYIGTSWIDLWLDPKDRAAAVAAVEAAAAGGTGTFVGFFRTFHGLDKWWDVAVNPIRDATGQATRLLAVSRDVTERRALEETLVARAEQLAQADRSKDEFLAMLAHELRNPLAPLRNAAELLKADDASADERAQAQSIISRQIENMSRMLEDLLDVSRITAGKIELRRKLVPLEGILTAAASLVRATCAAHKQDLAVSLPKEPVYLNADATRLEQVFGNLLGNACKYSGDGCHICITAECVRDAEPPEVVVTVRDDGAGIDPELLPHIFDLFVQASRTLDRSHGGLGIGLTLVQRLVKLHGGSIEAHSEGHGHGAEFVVHLPILTEAPPPEPLPAAPSQHSAPGPTRRILIVDDNTDSARSLATLQKRRGHETRTASTGPEAVATAAEFLPEVVLLDIGLPGMDGFEVARQIRAIPALAGALLIAMSGYGREEDRAEAKLAGFDEYMVKPVDLDALREWLQNGSRS